MSDLFSKNFKKQSARAKEKLLVTLGKADQTHDEIYEEHANNFLKQQKAADRLQKEFKNYVACIKNMSIAAKGFQEALRETYEPEWPGLSDVRAMSQSLELVWDDYYEKMVGQVLNPLTSHANQFIEVRGKMEKRGRKRIDFDHARHAYDSSKTASEIKQQKALEQLNIAKRIYEDLNCELSDELPALYDSRITFYVNNIQSVFNLEQTFHSETAKLSRELCVQMDELGHALARLRVPRKSQDSSSGGGPSSTITAPSTSIDTIVQQQTTANSTNIKDDNKNGTSLPPIPPSATTTTNNNHHHHPANNEQTSPPPVAMPPVAMPKTTAVQKNQNGKETASSLGRTGGGEDENNGDESGGNPFGSSDSEPNSRRPSAEDSEMNNGKKAEAGDDIADSKGRSVSPAAGGSSELTSEAPVPTSPQPKTSSVSSNPNILYKVRATHRYTAEDSDELSFEAGEIIDVIPYEDPEEQDEGWLNGLKESEGTTGVFPANFTKPV